MSATGARAGRTLGEHRASEPLHDSAREAVAPSEARNSRYLAYIWQIPGSGNTKWLIYGMSAAICQVQALQFHGSYPAYRGSGAMHKPPSEIPTPESAIHKPSSHLHRRLSPISRQERTGFVRFRGRWGQVSPEGNRETGRAGSYRNQTGTGQICPISRKWEGSLSRNRTKWGGFCLILGK